MSGNSKAFSAVLDFKRAQLMGAVERVEPIAEVEGGLAVFTPSLPSVWELNLVLGSGGSESETIEQLMQASERLLGAAGLAHRKLRLSGPGPGDNALEAVATAAGWDVDRELVMVRARAPDGKPSPRAAMREITADELAQAEDRFLMSEPYGRDPLVRRQLTAQHERWARAATTASCIGIVEDGQVLGWCRLYEDHGVIELDSVGVLPDQRGRGLGRALLEGVLARVPPDRLLFLVADTDDWPKDLYGRLGFDVLGERLGATKPDGAV